MLLHGKAMKATVCTNGYCRAVIGCLPLRLNLHQWLLQNLPLNKQDA